MLRKSIYPYLQKAKKMPYIIIYNLLKRTRPLDTKKVVLASNTRRDISGNLLYIYNYLCQNDSEKNIKILTKRKENFLYNIFFQFLCAIDMSNAKYIIIDDFFPLVYTFNIREKSKLIQPYL